MFAAFSVYFCLILVAPGRPIPLILGKFRRFFLKRSPGITSPEIIATEPVLTVILNFLGHFPNLSRQGSRYSVNFDEEP